MLTLLLANRDSIVLSATVESALLSVVRLAFILRQRLCWVELSVWLLVWHLCLFQPTWLFLGLLVLLVWWWFRPTAVALSFFNEGLWLNFWILLFEKSIERGVNLTLKKFFKYWLKWFPCHHKFISLLRLIINFALKVCSRNIFEIIKGYHNRGYIVKSFGINALM